MGDQKEGALFTSFEKMKAYNEKAFSPVTVYASADYKVIMVYLRAGQFIPTHAPNADLILLVHAGTGQVVGGSKKAPVKPGDLVIVRRGERRGVMAYTDMELLHVVSPPPDGADHEEMRKKLAAGRFD